MAPETFDPSISANETPHLGSPGRNREPRLPQLTPNASPSHSNPTTRLLVDVTATHASELKTGIQRVTIELYQWLVRLLEGLNDVIPIYLTKEDGQWMHRQANTFRHRVLALDGKPFDDLPVQLDKDDRLLHLDLATTPVYQAFMQGLYRHYQQRGALIFSIIYDLLPIRLPDCFPPGMDQHHRDWLVAVSSFDGALCISRDVAHDLSNWYEQSQMDVCQLPIDWFKLGANIGTFRQEKGGKDADSKTSQHDRHQRHLKRFGLMHAKTFLMVGTIEPRKGYAQVLAAFEQVWRLNLDCRLIIVGREGWTHLGFEERASILQVVAQLEQHPERFRRLLWLSSADDSQLQAAYEQADCLIAASLGEGFGLPIIEATSRGLPVLARDIPVFREAAPIGTKFFTDGGLVKSIVEWTPPSESIEYPPCVTWQESTSMVIDWINHRLEYR